MSQSEGGKKHKHSQGQPHPRLSIDIFVRPKPKKVSFREKKIQSEATLKVYLVELMIFTNSGLREAPPTRKPLISC